MSSLLKDTLHKQASVWASEGVTSDGAACSLVPGDHSQSLGDFKRASASNILHESACHVPDRPASGKGEHTEKASQAKELHRSEKLDSKLANIDYLRKKMSLDDKDDSHCAPLKPKVISNTHECLAGNPVRPMAGQQEILPASESRPFVNITHTPQISAASFVPLKALAGRVENGGEKPGLIVPESPVRKSPSEYKLEGRSVSCLKPIEGTLDIALLSGPHASKTQLPSPEPAQSPSPGVTTAPSVPLPTLPNSSGKKGESTSLRESSSASLKVNKSNLLEPRFLPPSRGTQDSLAAPGPEPKSKQDRKVIHPAARSTATVTENSLQHREGGSTKHQDRSSDTKVLPVPGQTLHKADAPRLCAHTPLPPEGMPSKEKPCLKEPSEKVKSERSAMTDDGRRDPSVKLCPAETGKAGDNSKNIPSGGRTHPDFYTQTQTMEKAWACVNTNSHRDGQGEVKSLAREESLHSAVLLYEKETGRARKGTEPKPQVPATRSPPQPSGIEGEKNENLSPAPSLQKQASKEADRKEQALQRPGGSGPQQPLATKELSNPAVWQHRSSPNHTFNRELGTKPAAAEANTSLQDSPQSATATITVTATTSAGHSDCSSHKSRPGPDPSQSKSKHPDRSPSSQKLSPGGSAKGKEPVAQPLGGSIREGKGGSKDPLDTSPAILATRGKASDVPGQGEVRVTITLHAEESPLDAKLKTTSEGCAPELQKYPPRQGHPGLSEAVGQKLLTAGEKQNLSPKHPKPSTVKDCPTLSRQTDKSPSQQATTGDRKSEGKKGTEVLYVLAPEGYKLEASPSLQHGDTRLKGPERPAMGTGKGFSESKGKGPGPQKPLAESGKPGGMKRSPSATVQSSLRPATPPEKSLSYSASFPEAQAGVREVTGANSPSSAKAIEGTSESPASSIRDHRKSQSGGEGRSQMTKSDSLPSFRLSNSVLESHFPDPQAPSTAGHRDRAQSVTATTGEPKGRELAQPPQTRKQNVGREVTRAPPAPSTDRSLPLASEKDFVVRQRRGKESLRSSPHKKTS